MNITACTTFSSRSTTMSKVALASAALATLALAPAAQASDSPSPSAAPSMKVNLQHSVSGHTLSYRYSDSGEQFGLTDEAGKNYFSDQSMGFRIDFGDGTPSDGADGAGGSSCMKGGMLQPFGMTMPAAKHTYAKTGTYTVKVTGMFCGKPGTSNVSRSFRVTVGAASAPTTNKGTSGQTGSATPQGTGASWMGVELPTRSVHGRTLTYTYADTGVQHHVKGAQGSYANTTAAGYIIAFGDGTRDSGNGMGDASCTTQGSAGFHDRVGPLTHTYARPGTYTVKATGQYCGEQGLTSKSVAYTVKVGAKANALPRATAPGTSHAPVGTPRAGASAHSAPAAASNGPKVETDRVTPGESDTSLYAGAAALTVLTGAGTVAARRHRKN